MAYDPYARDAPGLNDPASNLVLVTPDDDNDLPIAGKALRVWNPTVSAAQITLDTGLGDTVVIDVPAESLWTEPLRVIKVHDTGTTAGMTIHVYTDRPTPP